MKSPVRPTDGAACYCTRDKVCASGAARWARRGLGDAAGAANLEKGRRDASSLVGAVGAMVCALPDGASDALAVRPSF